MKYSTVVKEVSNDAAIPQIGGHPEAREPNALINLAWAGALLVAGGIFTPGEGLLRRL